jgi:hypothetical protein
MVILEMLMIRVKFEKRIKWTWLGWILLKEDEVNG